MVDGRQEVVGGSFKFSGLHKIVDGFHYSGLVFFVGSDALDAYFFERLLIDVVVDGAVCGKNSDNSGFSREKIYGFVYHAYKGGAGFFFNVSEPNVGGVARHRKNCRAGFYERAAGGYYGGNVRVAVVFSE